MGYMNIRTPRIYPDMINYLLNRGVAQNGNFDVLATDDGAYKMGTFTTGSEPELFDMKPLNKCTFDTSADTDGHVMINIDLQQAYKTSFVAILNHNMDSADAKVLIKSSNTEAHIQAVDMGSATAMNSPVEVINADAISSSIITPATDGSTIVRFATTNHRYWGIQFEGDSSNTFGSTDLFVGCILIGEYYDMTQAPDLSVNRSISFDGMNKVQQSVGGQRYSNMSNHGRQSLSASLSPFTLKLIGGEYEAYGGRITYDLNFSFLNSGYVMPDEYRYWSGSFDATVEDMWHITHGSHTPFIFSIDKDSEGDTAESEHIFARWGQDSLNMTQVALDTFNVSMRIEEEF